MKKIFVSIMIAIMGACMFFYYPYFCAIRIINAIEKDVSTEEFAQIVDNNRSGIDSPNRCLPIWEAIDVVNYCPLQYACAIGDIDKVRTLLKAGADPNMCYKSGLRTPLLETLNSGNDNRFVIAGILLDAGADPDIKDGQLSPLYDSLIIRDNGDRQKQMDESVSLFKRLLEQCQSINQFGDSDTLLGCAAAYGNEKAVEYILEEKINDVNDVSKTGRTALMSSVMAYDNYKMCSYLIEIGADKYARDFDGKTAYDYAVEFGRVRCAEVCK